MTSTQQSAYWRLWSAACKAQGWTRENGLDAAAIDHHRKECLAECGFESSKNIDSGAGFSRWKSLCERLSGKLVGAVKEVRQNTPADRRRWVIENEMIPCIAWYAPETTRDRVTGVKAMSDTHTNHAHEPSEAIAAFFHTCKHCGVEIEPSHCKQCNGFGVRVDHIGNVVCCVLCSGTGVEKWVEVKT